MSRTSTRLLVVDFDGTLVEQNTLELVVERFGDLEGHRDREGRLGLTVALAELLKADFASVRAPLDEVVEMLCSEVRFRAGAEELVRVADERGWRLLILSSAPRELIEPLLERQGLRGAELIANAVAPDPAGWRLELRDPAVCPICGEACKRRIVEDLRDEGEVVYVGDGYSDACGARVADLVFARRRLASFLEERGLPYRPFEDFHEIARALAERDEADLASRAARLKTEVLIWRERARRAEDKLADWEAWEGTLGWKLFLAAAELRSRLAPTGSWRDRMIRRLLRSLLRILRRASAPPPSPPSGTRKAVLFVSGRPGATRRYRCDFRAEQLALAGASVDVVALPGANLGAVLDNYRCIVLHRVPFDPAVEAFLGDARSRGISVLFDADDLIFHPQFEHLVPGSARHDDGVRRHCETLERCDGVLVSTEPLAEFARPFNPRVEVVYNVAGESLTALSAASLERRAAPDGTVVVAYLSGTATHDRDFREAADAVLWALETYAHVRFAAVGHLALDPRFEAYEERIDRVPFVPWEELPDVIAGIDVNLAPLERGNPFSACKSCLKFIEAGLLRVPTVASRQPDFARAIEHGRNGLLAEELNEWRAAVGSLIESPELRSRLGRAAWEDIRSAHSAAAEPTAARSALRRLLPRPDGPLVVNWVAGGTGFRNCSLELARHLALAGHDVLLYGDCAGARDLPVAPAGAMLRPADVSVATDPSSATRIAGDDRSLFRCYLVTRGAEEGEEEAFRRPLLLVASSAEADRVAALAGHPVERIDLPGGQEPRAALRLGLLGVSGDAGRRRLVRETLDRVRAFADGVEILTDADASEVDVCLALSAAQARAALSAGCALVVPADVATPAGLPEPGRNCIVAPPDAEALAGAVRRLMVDESLRARLYDRRSGNWAAPARRLERLLDEACFVRLAIQD